MASWEITYKHFNIYLKTQSIFLLPVISEEKLSAKILLDFHLRITKNPRFLIFTMTLCWRKRSFWEEKNSEGKKNNVFRHFAFKQCQWLSAMYRLNQNRIKKPFRENEHTKWGRCVATVWVALALILLSTDCSFDRQKNQNHVEASKILPKLHWQKPNYWSKKVCCKKMPTRCALLAKTSSLQKKNIKQLFVKLFCFNFK